MIRCGVGLLCRDKRLDILVGRECLAVSAFGQFSLWKRNGIVLLMFSPLLVFEEMQTSFTVAVTSS